MPQNHPQSEIMTALLSRRSVPFQFMSAPAPTQDEIDQILTAATRVPDHCCLTPWRITLVQGDDRTAFGEALIAGYVADTADPQTSRIAKLKAMAQSPMTCIVSSHIEPNEKVPETEQILSGGAVCQNLMLAANAFGYVATWLTGPAAYSPTFKASLGLADGDIIIGFVIIGTGTQAPKERPRPALADIVSNWPHRSRHENPAS